MEVSLYFYYYICIFALLGDDFCSVSPLEGDIETLMFANISSGDERHAFSTFGILHWQKSASKVAYFAFKCSAYINMFNAIVDLYTACYQCVCVRENCAPCFAVNMQILTNIIIIIGFSL